MKKTKKLVLVMAFLCAGIMLVPLCSCGSNNGTSQVEGSIHITGSSSGYVGDTIILTSDVDGVLWASSDNNIATVKDGTVTLIKKGTVTIKASKTNYTDAKFIITISEKTVTPIENITITGTSTVKVGSIITLTSSVSDVTWASSDTKVATINGGVVTGVSVGSVTITASKTGYNSGTFNLTVEEGESDKEYTLNYDASKAKNLAANVPSGGVYIKTDGISDDFDGIRFDYLNNQVGVANSPYSKFNCVQLKAKGLGAISTSEITLKSLTLDYYTTFADEFNLVVKIGSTELKATPSEAVKTGDLVSGKYELLKYALTYDIPSSLTGSMIMESPKYASYFSNLNMDFLAKNSGSNLPSMKISGSKSIKVGGVTQLKAFDKDGNELNGVTWKVTRNSSSCTVNSDGLVSARHWGSSIVTAYKEGYQDTSVEINVAGLALVTNGPSSVGVGESLVFTANVDGSEYSNIGWMSSDPSIATVDSNTGVVTGVKAGTAAITCIDKRNMYYAGSITITVESTVTYSTISETRNMSSGTNVVLKGLVVQKDAKGFVIYDGTGFIDYYNSNFIDVDVGSVYKFTGSLVDASTNYYWNKFTSKSKLTYAKMSGVVISTPSEEAYATLYPSGFVSGSKANMGHLVAIKGHLNAAGKFVSEDETGTNYVSFNDSNNAPTFVTGKRYLVKGIVGDNKYCSIYLVSSSEIDFETPTSIAINDASNASLTSSTCYQDGSVQLKATVNPEKGTSQDVSWSISDQSGKVTIDSNGLVSATVDATTGTYTVTAKSSLLASITTTYTITVATKIKVSSVAITGNSSDALLQNDTRQLSATISPSDATVTDVKWEVKSTPSGAVANKVTIDSNGLVSAATGATAGNYVIRCTSLDDSTKYADATVLVSSEVLAKSTASTATMPSLSGTYANNNSATFVIDTYLSLKLYQCGKASGKETIQMQKTNSYIYNSTFYADASYKYYIKSIEINFATAGDVSIYSSTGDSALSTKSSGSTGLVGNNSAKNTKFVVTMPANTKYFQILSSTSVTSQISNIIVTYNKVAV